MISNGYIVFGIISVSLFRYEEEVWRLAFRHSKIYGNRHFADIHIQRHAECVDIYHSGNNSSSNPLDGLMAIKR